MNYAQEIQNSFAGDLALERRRILKISQKRMLTMGELALLTAEQQDEYWLRNQFGKDYKPSHYDVVVDLMPYDIDSGTDSDAVNGYWQDQDEHRRLSTQRDEEWL